jgi:hypothetical protein
LNSNFQRSALLCFPLAVAGATGVLAQDAPTSPTQTIDSTGFIPNIDEFSFGGLLRMSLDYSPDDVYEIGGERLSGVRFQDALLWVEAKTGIFDVRVMAKAADSNGFPPSNSGDVDALEVRDAWVRADAGNGLNVYAGKYKCPLVASANVDYGHLIMIDRTRIGQFFSGEGAYQPGAAVTWDNESFHAKLALQNGADGVVDAYGIVARGEFKLGGGAAYREGAYGAPDDWAATVGAGYFNDGSQIGGMDFGSAIALDGYATMNKFSVHAEILDMDEELAGRTGLSMGGDATPFSATFGYLFQDNMEVALRIQDLDDDDDTTLIGGGFNYYLSGHDAKLQFNISQFDDDNDDGMLYQVGLAVGFGKRFGGD